MTPQQKAKELTNNHIKELLSAKYLLSGFVINDLAKLCALLAVDEILRSEPRSPSNVDWDDVGGTHQYYYEAQREEADKYWHEVKQEIGKL